jgi:hypothetical protein
MKLSHREPKAVAREAELKATLAVGSSDVLGHGIEIINITSLPDSVAIEIGDVCAELSRADCESLVGYMNVARANQSNGLKSQLACQETAQPPPPRQTSC